MLSITIQGGLGNQLFEISAVIGLALKHDLQYCIPTKVINPHYPLSPGQSIYFFPGIKYCNEKLVDPSVYNEPFFHYQEIPVKQNENLILSGYFQSFKYLNGYKEQILKALGFDNIVTIPDVCSLHYRSTDYKNHPDVHPIISREYIGVAIGNMWFKGYKKFLIFSDDIPEIKEVIESFYWAKDIEFEYSEGKSALEDLRLMASCSSNITANSTLSLWGAYINPNPDKVIISPLAWFGESVNHITSDLYIPNSIIL